MTLELGNNGSKDVLRLTAGSFALITFMALSCVFLLATETIRGTDGGVKTWNVLDWLSQQAILSTNFSCDDDEDDNKCRNFSFKYVVRNACEERPFLLFLVATAHNNTEARTAIRRTWGGLRSHRGRIIKTVFVFGEHDDDRKRAEIVREQAEYGDVVAGSFPDSYRTLTEKVVFALRWSRDHCPASYVVKTDDDVFHVPHGYVDYLLDNELPERFVGGRCLATRPTRTATIKTYVPRDVYPYSYSPYYCQGGGYILSQAAVRDIVAVAPTVRYTPMEDQFVSGICRYSALVPYYQIDGVLARKGAQTQPCTLKRLVKSTHKVYPDEMFELWENLNSRQPTCALSYDVKLFAVTFIFLLLWTRFLYSMY